MYACAIERQQILRKRNWQRNGTMELYKKDVWDVELTNRLNGCSEKEWLCVIFALYHMCPTSPWNRNMLNGTIHSHLRPTVSSRDKDCAGRERTRETAMGYPGNDVCENMHWSTAFTSLPISVDMLLLTLSAVILTCNFPTPPPSNGSLCSHHIVIPQSATMHRTIWTSLFSQALVCCTDSILGHFFSQYCRFFKL